MNGIERGNAVQRSCIDDRSKSRIRPGSPSGTEAPDHLAMNDRGAQVSLTDIVGWIDIATVQEDEQAIPVFGIALQESFSFFLLRRALEQPVADVLDLLDTGAELWW